MTAVQVKLPLGCGWNEERHEINKINGYTGNVVGIDRNASRSICFWRNVGMG